MWKHLLEIKQERSGDIGISCEDLTEDGLMCRSCFSAFNRLFQLQTGIDRNLKHFSGQTVLSYNYSFKTESQESGKCYYIYCLHINTKCVEDIKIIVHDLVKYKVFSPQGRRPHSSFSKMKCLLHCREKETLLQYMEQNMPQ